MMRLQHVLFLLLSFFFTASTSFTISSCFPELKKQDEHVLRATRSSSRDPPPPPRQDISYNKKNVNRRDVIMQSTFLIPAALASLSSLDFNSSMAANAATMEMDVNNMLAREYTAFPGLFPTIATKIVNGGKDNPYKTKKDVYAVLTSDIEIERLQQYDKMIVIRPVDKSIKQFKESQICKYECGGRVSSSYRNEQIRQVQLDRR